MARLSTANSPAPPPDPTAINLSRMLERLQQTLINPDSATEARLRASSLERGKVGTNLEHARSLLMRLEQDATSIKIQGKKQETQGDLSRKRELLQRLGERLQELDELGGYEENEDDTSEGEDILGEDTPSEETDASHADPTSETPSPRNTTPPPTSPSFQAPPPVPEPYVPPPAPAEEPQSILRARTKDLRAELLTPAATSTGMSTATSEALLTHNRTEQENLEESLISMVAALKESSMAFGQSLAEEKDVLDNATKGLDKNELGLEAASRRMGYLRTMTEGRGWWGRMLMYAWIFGLMVIAILVVFVLPKLRF